MSSVVIVGLTMSQFRRLEEGMKKKSKKKQLRLVWASGKSNRANLPKGDWCVLAVRWIGHCWSNEARRMYAADRVRVTTGGPSTVERLLEELA